MPASKIVIIGAGSDIFGLNMVATLMRSKVLRGSTLMLVDRNASALESMMHLAKRVNREWLSGMVIKSTTDTIKALPGANFVICAIGASPREGLWKSDYEIPLKLGVRQPYAENSGPGGFAQAARNIPMIMDIVHGIEKHCPQALFINFTNPMQRICDAVHRYSFIRVVGLCHQISAGYSMVGRTLGRELGIESPAAFIGTHSSPAINPARQQVALAAMKKVSIRAAGVNHFTWMLALTDRESGEDLYLQFAKRWQALSPDFEPLTRRIYELFGLFPIPGDEHLCEYLPWMSDPQTKPWEKYDLSLYEWNLRSRLREKDRAQIRELAEGKGGLDRLADEQSEGAAEVIQGVIGGKTIAWDAVNLPNHGLIDNLPEDAIVEVPGRLGARGPKGVAVGALPKGIAELCRREITTSQLCVDAAVKGDRKLALQSLLLDPVVRDIDTGQKILDAYLKTYSKYLPQFA